MISEEEYKKAAEMIGCEVAALKAVQQVETGGKGGFVQEGRPAILFEGHVFWSQLKKVGIDPESMRNGNEDILYKIWTKTHYKGGIREWERLSKAVQIHREAALKSASWGMFQVMGFNYELCGTRSVNDFVDMMCESEGKQLMLTARLICNSYRMRDALKKKNWESFARYYNGPGYKENRYDEKIKAAYEKFKK